MDDDGLTVAMPLRASERWLNSVLQEKAPWIVKALAGWQSCKVEPIRWEDGAAIPFLGENLTLRLVPSLFGSAPMLQRRQLFVHVADVSHHAAIEQAVVDAFSVWRGPTHTITTQHFEIYTSVSIAFVVAGHRAPAYLGPPDILFYALFRAAALRWRLRPGWTWLATTGMYSISFVIVVAAHLDGLPALPFLSFGFLAVNGDLLWKRLRRAPS